MCIRDRIPAEPAQPWGARRPPVLSVQISELHAAIDHITTDGLGEDIGRILLTRPFGQDEVTQADAFLRPQLSHRQVADASNA
eukprot:9548828-Alexandrium_andersonii.AAC.1